ncbi:MAG: Rrf2 family transcriptional regulator [Phycisphaeraceae bacterium]
MLSALQTTGYAILALGCLGRVGSGWTLARDIAACIGVPLPYLSQILHNLGRSGLIHSKRGYRGGFALSRAPEQISLLQITQAIEGPEYLPRCLLGLADCPAKRLCPTHAFWKVERRRIEAELRKVTLAEVAAFVKRRCKTKRLATASLATTRAKTSRTNRRGRKKPKAGLVRRRV